MRADLNKEHDTGANLHQTSGCLSGMSTGQLSPLNTNQDGIFYIIYKYTIKGEVYPVKDNAHIYTNREQYITDIFKPKYNKKHNKGHN